MPTTSGSSVGAGSLPGRSPRERLAEYEELERRLGLRFSDAGLLERALTHGSRAHEEGGLAVENERLEFLGDAVLGLIVAEILMEAHPDADEGALSRARAAAVNATALAARARELGLDRWIRLGRGEERSGGREKLSILANAFEAVLGALYLDGGSARARAFIERELGTALRQEARPLDDAKTRLQELVHQQGAEGPSYELVAEHGPDHAKEFEVRVCCGARSLGSGRGRSKREAEQDAARQAIEVLGR